MSCSLWNWTPACDNRTCPGDCDLCNYEDDTYTVDEPTVSYKGEENEKL